MDSTVGLKVTLLVGRELGRSVGRFEGDVVGLRVVVPGEGELAGSPPGPTTGDKVGS